MTTVEYAAWARYADANRGDQRSQQILATIGSMLANTWKKQGAAPITSADFAPWIEWQGAPADDDPYADPLMSDL